MGKREAQAEKPAVSRSAERRERYPLTHSARLQLYACQSNGKPVDINDVIFFIDLNPETDEERLCRAIETMVKKHPTYQMGVDCETNEMVLRHEPFVVEIADMDEAEFVAFRRSKNYRVRDLMRDPLFEAKIIHQGERRYLFFDFNHLIYDAVSLRRFLEGVEEEYNGKGAAEETVSVFDVALYEQALRDTPYCRQALAYLDRCYEGLPEVRLFDAAPCTTTVMKPLLEGLEPERFRQRLRELHTSALHFYLTALELTVKKLWKCSDFAYLVIHSGRKQPELRDTYGVLANGVFLRAQREAVSDAGEYMSRVHGQYKSLVQYDVLSVPELVERYPNLPSGLTFNYHGGLTFKDRLTLDGADNMGNEELYYESVAAMQPFTPCDFSIRTYDGDHAMAMIASARLSQEQAQALLDTYDQTLRSLMETSDLGEIT